MTYSNPLALERLDKGVCPECGGEERDHTGWGGPRGCSLTDYGVALRVYEYQKARDVSERIPLEGERKDRGS